MTRRPFFSATALASTVASKLGSAMLSVVTSFWGSSKPQSKLQAQPQASSTTDGDELPESAQRPADPLALEYSLEDPRRRLRALYPSPKQNKVAMTDDFGRVLLFDKATSTISRVWKGYRDAQCGWIVAVEATDPANGLETPSTRARGPASRSASAETSATPRECMFLAILAPKRQLLEIWTAALGTRVAAFNVADNSVLVTLRDGLQSHMGGGLPADCYLMSPANKTMKKISVPFESALSNSLSSSTQDRHQLRRLKSLLAALSDAGSKERGGGGGGGGGGDNGGGGGGGGGSSICSIRSGSSGDSRVDGNGGAAAGGAGDGAGAGDNRDGSGDGISGEGSVGAGDGAGNGAADDSPAKRILGALKAIEAPVSLCEAVGMLGAVDLADSLIRAYQDQLEVQAAATAEAEGGDPVAQAKLDKVLKHRRGQIEAYDIMLSATEAAVRAATWVNNNDGVLPSSADAAAALNIAGVAQAADREFVAAIFLACLAEAKASATSLSSPPSSSPFASSPSSPPRGSESMGSVGSLGSLPEAALNISLGGFVLGVEKTFRAAAGRATRAASHRRAATVLSDDERDSLARCCFQSVLMADGGDGEDGPDAADAATLAAAWLSMGLTCSQLMKLLLHFCFELPLWALLQASCMKRLKSAVAALAAAWKDAVEAALDGDGDDDVPAILPLHVVFTKCCTSTPSLTQAYIAALLGRAACHPDERKAFDVLAGRLGDAVCVVLVGGSGVGADGKGRDASLERSGISVQTLLANEGGICGAIVESLLAAGLTPADLAAPSSGAATGAAAASAPSEIAGFVASVQREGMPAPTSAAPSLALLRHRLPAATSSAVLSVRCAALMLRQWEGSRSDSGLLFAALAFIDAGGHDGLRQAVLHNVWLQSLKMPFLLLVSLVKKTRKAPKERLCRDELKMDKQGAGRFSLATQMVVSTMQALNTRKSGCNTNGGSNDDGDENSDGGHAAVAVAPHGVDARWEAGHADTETEKRLLGGGGGASFADAASAMDGGGLNQVVVQQHVTLCKAITMVMLLELRSVRPYDLFSDAAENMLFAPLEREHPNDDVVAAAENAAGAGSTMVYDDPTQAGAAASAAELQSARRQFLSRALCAAVHASPQMLDGESEGAAAVPSTAEVLELASAMGLGADDVLQRQYVANLYEIGEDAAASGALLQVGDSAAMLLTLLELIGLRLAILLDRREDGGLAFRNRVPAPIFEWCAKWQKATPLPGRGPCVKVPIDKIQSLVAQAQACVTDDSIAPAQRLKQLASCMDAL